MAILSKHDVDVDCVEKGKMWADYILNLSSSFLLRKMDVSKLIVSFDVLVTLVHFTAYQRNHSELCRLYQNFDEPAELDMIPFFDKYFFFTPNEKLEVSVDFLAQPETIEFV